MLLANIILKLIPMSATASSSSRGVRVWRAAAGSPGVLCKYAHYLHVPSKGMPVAYCASACLVSPLLLFVSDELIAMLLWHKV